ncbi:hypothetical protein [Streptomyces zagrosensis]|uniref:Integral membrane protein n=1 Tax=Streptomyces zagrosensis TaxID=1042984 RepID=A0A7W9QAL4_9ACTN|nr:hypothetical protein [Streptomyces zagrosensis]MBB5936619.1 hypothetical protein [Streptomyces zagrosensis]
MPPRTATPQLTPDQGRWPGRGAVPWARWRAARGGERLCYATGAVLVASGLFHLGVFAVDGGAWEGPVSWRKPFTFGLSFGLTLIAVTWVASYLRMGARTRVLLCGAFAADCVLEVAGITLQAWRGVPSHFNMETPFNTFVSLSLAVGGAILVVILSAFAVASFLREPEGPVGMAQALRAGFAILLIALLSGAAMIARGVVLTRTGHQEAGYHSTGFLKPLHGVSLHAILVLPALAWLLTRTPLDREARRKTVAIAVGCYWVAVVGAGLWAIAAYCTASCGTTTICTASS